MRGVRLFGIIAVLVVLLGCALVLAAIVRVGTSTAYVPPPSLKVASSTERPGYSSAPLPDDEARSYCEQTNPHPGHVDFINCANSANGDAADARGGSLFEYVVTMTEDELLGALTERLRHGSSARDAMAAVYAAHLRWIDELPGLGRRTLYVKSNATRSYRQHGMAWEAGLRAKLSGEVMFSDVGSSPAPGQRVFRSVARDAPFASCVSVVETPNVGDEALSIAHFAAANYERLAAKLRSLEALGRGLVPYVAFVHGHRSSWHALDVVRQFECLCMSSSERYRTLTTPARAFFLQCMPLLDPNATTADAASAAGQLALSPVQAAQLAPLDGPQRERLLRFFQRQQAALLGISRRFGAAFRAIFPDEPLPPAVVRDCCASFVVSAAAIGQRPRAFYERLQRMLAAQPNLAVFPLVDGDASMYLERFWRHIFGATDDDLQRDLTNLRCQQSRFECPLSDRVMINISLEDGSVDLKPQWRGRRCPSHALNRFRS